MNEDKCNEMQMGEGEGDGPKIGPKTLVNNQVDEKNEPLCEDATVPYPRVGKPTEEPNLSIFDEDGNSLGFSINFPISFEEYQAGAKKTAIYNQDARVLYPALGLAGEVGELGEKVLQMAVHAGKCANQVKKIIRDDDCECDTPRKHAIGKEIGGVLWYCAAVASDLGLSLANIAQENLDILSSRQERGTIQGDGDER